MTISLLAGGEGVPRTEDADRPMQPRRQTRHLCHADARVDDGQAETHQGRGLVTLLLFGIRLLSLVFVLFIVIAWYGFIRTFRRVGRIIFYK